LPIDRQCGSEKSSTVIDTMNRYLLKNSLVIGLICVISPVLGCGSKSKDAQKEKATRGLEKTIHGLTPEQASKVLVKVGDTSITVGQFAERLASQSPYLRARYQNPERRREFLDNMVEFELLAAEAKKGGYDKKPEVERAKKQKIVQKMMKALFDEKGAQVSEVTDDEIQAYFDQHQDEFQKSEQVRASHILVKDKAVGQKVLKQALAAPDDMSLFRKLAQQFSQDAATREQGGDLRFFSRVDQKSVDEPTVPDEVRTAAFSLKNIGDVQGSLVQSSQGFHVVKLTGRRDAYKRTLEEARRTIQSRIWRERREKAIEAFVNDLRQKAKVQENLALLDQIQIPGQVEAAPGKAKSTAAPQANQAARPASSLKPVAAPATP
jgi:peptidyl-prolyl cis-trans isomerase C